MSSTNNSNNTLKAALSSSPEVPRGVIPGSGAKTTDSVDEGLSMPISSAFLDAVAARVLERLGERLDVSVSPYATVDEAAEYLRCKPQRIYDLLSARRLTRFKDGSRVLVLRAELDEYVASSLPPASPDRTAMRRVA